MAKDKENYGKKLYDLLPPVYKTEDANIRPDPFPLKRFLQVNGTGLDFLEGKLEGHQNLYDIDKTHAMFLPHLAQMMGFDFPYEMTESEQRTFLKTLPIMYKYKGTSRVFDYLGQVIFGVNTRVETVYRLNKDPEYDYKHVIDIRIQVTGNTQDIPAKAERYRKFAERFRPLNSVISPVVQTFYTDEYQTITNADLNTDSIFLVNRENDGYDTNRIKEIEENTLLLNTETDSYNKVNATESYDFVAIAQDDGTEVYTATKTDGHDDYAHYIGATLNAAILNDTMVLNSKKRTVKL